MLGTDLLTSDRFADGGKMGVELLRCMVAGKRRGESRLLILFKLEQKHFQVNFVVNSHSCVSLYKSLPFCEGYCSLMCHFK